MNASLYLYNVADIVKRINLFGKKYGFATHVWYIALDVLRGCDLESFWPHKDAGAATPILFGTFNGNHIIGLHMGKTAELFYVLLSPVNNLL